MKAIDEEQIEQIQALLTKESAAVTFYKKGMKSEDGYWYLTNKDVSEVGKQSEDGDPAFYREKDIEDFIAFAQSNELVATVNFDGRTGNDETFEDWDHLARYMGISDMIMVGVKVPKKIAEKFQYYATKETTVSQKLRELILGYVIEQIKENAEKDAFR